VLIHSAGGLLPADARTREGVDRGLAQNFLAPFVRLAFPQPLTEHSILTRPSVNFSARCSPARACPSTKPSAGRCSVREASLPLCMRAEPPCCAMVLVR